MGNRTIERCIERIHWRHIHSRPKLLSVSNVFPATVRLIDNWERDGSLRCFHLIWPIAVGRWAPSSERCRCASLIEWTPKRTIAQWICVYKFTLHFAFKILPIVYVHFELCWIGTFACIRHFSWQLAYTVRPYPYRFVYCPFCLHEML